MKELVLRHLANIPFHIQLVWRSDRLRLAQHIHAVLQAVQLVHPHRGGVIRFYDLKSGPTRVWAFALTLMVPAWMCTENWDDHDRSGRRAAATIARTTLESLDRDAVIFVDGDNFTFPCSSRRSGPGWHICGATVPG